MSKKSPQGDKSSIKYRWVPLDLPCLGPAEVASARGTQVGSYSRTNSTQADGCSRTNCNRENVASCSNRIVTTPEFISAMGRLWKAVIQPLDVSQPKACAESPSVFQQGKAVGYSGSEASQRTSALLHLDLLPFDKKSTGCFAPTAKSNYEYLNTVKRRMLSKPCKESISASFQESIEVCEFHKSMGSMILAGTTGIGVPQCLVTMYENINPPLKDRISFSKINPELVAENCDLGKSSSETNVSMTLNAKAHINLAGNRNSPIGKSRETCKYSTSLYDVYLIPPVTSVVEPATISSCNFEQSSTSLYDAYLIPPVTSGVEPATISSCPSSNLYSAYGIRFSPSMYCTCKECQQSPDSFHTVLRSPGESVAEDDGGKKLYYDPLGYGRSFPDAWLSVQNKVEDAFLKGKHAIAGGLAGIFVSLCLHPIDTVKTVIQAHGMKQKPILHTIESIISERGVVGLYRGIASNIASSAPISAVYTYTYESVKGALLPLLPIEYHSLAHCTAGGCASVATSFIFTPSERIKQQMQVHSYYHNCWNALVGILERGGLPSLYAGWGAVLCRNIPHSVIKFYMYERLKQLLRPPTEDAYLNTLQTLVCGGLAGSTAALFTTPFDVVKTRLQAQVPGSLKRYDGVFHVLKEIAKHEGINGLYRGLTPRLLMYVSQGAIFFASYEFLKTIFSFEASVRSGRGIKNERYTEDECH